MLPFIESSSSGEIKILLSAFYNGVTPKRYYEEKLPAYTFTIFPNCLFHR